MKKTGLFDKDNIANLTGDHRRFSRQHTNDAKPLSESEPEKKSFWRGLWDKTKMFCNEFKETIVTVGTIVGAVAVITVNAVKAKKNIDKLREKPDKKQCKKNRKKSSKATVNNYFIIETLVWQ